MKGYDLPERWDWKEYGSTNILTINLGGTIHPEKTGSIIKPLDKDISRKPKKPGHASLDDAVTAHRKRVVSKADER